LGAPAGGRQRSVDLVGAALGESVKRRVGSVAEGTQHTGDIFEWGLLGAALGDGLFAIITAFGLTAAAIRDVHGRGRLPILAGGTGFYLRALVKPLFEGPPTDSRLRERLAALRDRKGPEHLHRMLTRIDPQAAVNLSPRDWPRTMRALEVYFQTGRRISESQPEMPPTPELASRTRVIALNPPREELYSRINKRADEMFDSGLVEEVESLISSGIPPAAKAFQAHGYRRVVEYLQGKRTRDDALNQMKLDTRHYAKRQLSWWRSWPGVKWIDRFGDVAEALEEANRVLTDDG